MPEPLDQVAKEMMESVGPKIFRQIGSQLEGLQDAIALSPADQEVPMSWVKRQRSRNGKPIAKGISLGGSKVPWRSDARPWRVWRF